MRSLPNFTPGNPPMTDHRQTVVLDPPGSPAASVIWLHGLGADGNDFVPIVHQLGLRERGVRFVLPHAPVCPVTINGGMAMRSWYDILSPEFGTREDAAGIQQSAAALTTLIEQEQAHGIAADRIVLAGFSQGGAVVLHTALRRCQPLAGVIALSTYLPLVDTLDTELSPRAAGLPVFMAHGRFDPLIPAALAGAGRDWLKARGVPVEWHDYPVEHGVDPDEVDDLRGWLERTLQLDPVAVSEP